MRSHLYHLGCLAAVAVVCVGVPAKAKDFGRSIFSGPRNAGQMLGGGHAPGNQVTPWQSPVSAGPLTTKNTPVLSSGHKGSSPMQGGGSFVSKLGRRMYGGTPAQRKVFAAPNGNTGINGSGLPQPWQQAKAIPARNGNTGITGAGLPSASNGARLGVFNKKMAHKVIAAPNGNTGITGAGLPRPGQVTGPSVTTKFKPGPGVTDVRRVPMYQNQSIADDVGGFFSDWGDFLTGHINDGKDLQLGAPLPPAAGVQFNKVANEAVTKKTPVSISPSNKIDPVANVRKVTAEPSTGLQKKATVVDRYDYEKLSTSPIGTPGGNAGPSSPPAPAPQPSKVPQFPFPYPSRQNPYPSGPVVMTQPAPVIASRSVPSAYVAPPQTVEQPVEPAATSVDIALEDLTLDAPATLVAGPAYRLKFRNQGSQAASKFQVAILAGWEGGLAEDAPRAIVEVPELGAGQVAEVTLRLPLAAIKPVSARSQDAFTHLYVAVDFQDTVAELDESNNSAVVERGLIEEASE